MRLLNRRKPPAHGGGLTGLNHWGKASVADMSKKTDCRDQSGAKESDHYHLQVRAPIRVIH
jgi:hypothetical protein